MIQVEYIDDYDCASLERGRVYEVVDVVEPFKKVVCYGIVDELGDKAYYPWNMFRVVSGGSDLQRYGIK